MNKISCAKKMVLTLLASVAVTGCSLANPMAVSKYEDADFKLFSNSAAVSNTAVRKAGDNRIICAGIGPDASLNEHSGGSFSLSMMHIGDKTNDSASEGETETSLGGRSANVLITREILYRQCELLGNADFSDNEKREIYENTLNALVEINKTNLGQGAEAQQAAQGTDMDISDSGDTSLTESDQTSDSDDDDEDDDSY